MTNIEKWKLTRNLIDAKKALDSLLYISKHTEDLYDVRGLCYASRSNYYINVCAVLDKSICANRRKKDIVNSDAIIKRIYTERDKHYAHKDKNYVPSFPYSSLEAEALSFQTELRHIRECCTDYLPDELTLDFVCYDSRLFRQVEKINPADEEKIKALKYPMYHQPTVQTGQGKTTFKVLYDIDYLNGLTEEQKKEYAVILEDGLTFEEGLQKRQDACVSINVLSDSKIWCHLNEEVWKRDLYLREVGIYDKFGILNITKIPQNLL